MAYTSFEATIETALQTQFPDRGYGAASATTQANTEKLRELHADLQVLQSGGNPEIKDDPRVADKIAADKQASKDWTLGELQKRTASIIADLYAKDPEGLAEVLKGKGAEMPLAQYAAAAQKKAFDTALDTLTEALENPNKPGEIDPSKMKDAKALAGKAGVEWERVADKASAKGKWLDALKDSLAARWNNEPQQRDRITVEVDDTGKTLIAAQRKAFDTTLDTLTKTLENPHKPGEIDPSKMKDAKALAEKAGVNWERLADKASLNGKWLDTMKDSLVAKWNKEPQQRDRITAELDSTGKTLTTRAQAADALAVLGDAGKELFNQKGLDLKDRVDKAAGALKDAAKSAADSVVTRADQALVAAGNTMEAQKHNQEEVTHAALEAGKNVASTGLKTGLDRMDKGLAAALAGLKTGVDAGKKALNDASDVADAVSEKRRNMSVDDMMVKLGSVAAKSNITKEANIRPLSPGEDVTSGVDFTSYRRNGAIVEGNGFISGLKYAAHEVKLNSGPEDAVYAYAKDAAGGVKLGFDRIVDVGKGSTLKLMLSEDDLKKTNIRTNVQYENRQGNFTEITMPDGAKILSRSDVVVVAGKPDGEGSMTLTRELPVKTIAEMRGASELAQKNGPVKTDGVTRDTTHIQVPAANAAAPVPPGGVLRP